MNRTPLYDLHLDLGARMVDFAGWSMPLLYTGILDEHHATRRGCTMFDVSHMGRLRISGNDALTLLERVCTRNIATLEIDQSRYSHICNESGGILDDVIVTRLKDRYIVVCNASNRDKINAWLDQHATDMRVTIKDYTRSTVMVAVQGPDTADIAGDLLPFDVSYLKRYRVKSGKYLGIEYVCARTGYTGEDGFEIIVSSATGKMLANSVTNTSDIEESKIRPAGLGCRDTLRLEAGMPLYGHELSEDIDPISAGQSWCVDLSKEFIGVEALRAIKENGPRSRLVGLELEGRRIARQGAVVQVGDNPIGAVTSGTFSPTLQKSIAMAMVDAQQSEVGTELRVDLRGQALACRIVDLPFYKRQKTRSG